MKSIFEQELENLGKVTEEGERVWSQLDIMIAQNRQLQVMADHAMKCNDILLEILKKGQDNPDLLKENK